MAEENVKVSQFLDSAEHEVRRCRFELKNAQQLKQDVIKLTEDVNYWR